GPGRIAPEKESSGTKNASNRSRVPIAPGEKRACSGQHVSSMAAGGPRLTKSAGAGLHHELGIGIGSAIQRGPKAFPSASQPVAPFPTSSPHCREFPAKVGTGEIGRASCRERVEISGAGVARRKKVVDLSYLGIKHARAYES